MHGLPIIVCLALACAAPAQAAPKWLGPQTLGDHAVVDDAPALALAPDGAATAVWAASNAQEPASVWASTRERGGAWSPAQRLDAGQQPRVVVDATGRTIAVWLAPGGLRESSRLPGGAWEPPRTVAPVQWDGRSPVSVALAAGPDGRVTAAWTSISAPGGVSATSRLPGGAWDAATPLSPYGANEVELLADPAGNLTAVWARNCTPSGPSHAEPPVQCGTSAATRPAGGTWSAQALEGSQDAARDPELAPLPGGGAIAMWATNGFVRSAERSPPGGWSGVAAVAAVRPGVASLSLGAADDGELVAAWLQGDAMQWTARRPGGSWQDPGPLVTGPLDASRVAVSPAGEAIAAWLSRGGPIRAAVRPPGAAWDPFSTIGSSPLGSRGTLSNLAADREGDAIVGWRALGDGSERVEVAAYDGGAPAIAGLSIPSGQIAQGQTVTLSASVSDAWSPASLRWDLGDGATATGATVTHAYGAPGSYPVTLTATDAVGNAATARGTVTVAGQAPDRDRDRVSDPRDNCPAIDNPSQADRDRDGIGDACDDNDGSRAPVPLKTVRVRVLSGEVFVRVPPPPRPDREGWSVRPRRGASAAQRPPRGFVRLRGTAIVPVGSTLDARRGRLELTSAADMRGRTQTGRFANGRFQIRQIRERRARRRRARGRPARLTTDLVLSGGSFRTRCRRTGKIRNPSSKGVVRSLESDAKGRFRTVGRASVSTVRGTVWVTEDRCDGTVTRVQKGTVAVRDLRRGRTVLVRAGRSYLARIRAQRRRRA